MAKLAKRGKGRKFGRERDQREALMAGLSVQLISRHSIRTTLAKAKELRPHVEKLVTLSKKGTLQGRRLIIARLDNNVQVGHYLMDTVAPSLSARDSGYLRIKRDGVRRGDQAPMARISFVDEIKDVAAIEKVEIKKPDAKVKKVKKEVKK